MTNKKKGTEKKIEKDPIEEVNELNQNVENTRVKEDDSAQKYEELNDTHLRLLAEFDNYRKRTMREKADLLKSAGEGLLTNMLPLIDDFERALQVMTDATDMVAVREGVELIYAKFIDFLGKNGVKAIDTNQKEFDTEFHEAITTIPSPEENLKGKVIDCVQKGYTLNDKVIRYSKVVVGE
ncbi:MAG: nucleotide exchange factor GrpE [Paludibacteraceae bacterium]|nr:nucleotide exchange factor GrpE [Paludibacteraceae bacterium]MBN2788077.1 nucleotide exchange factor GrpE [Paludibacteraceae bacterium]